MLVMLLCWWRGTNWCLRGVQYCTRVGPRSLTNERVETEQSNMLTLMASHLTYCVKNTRARGDTILQRYMNVDELFIFKW